MKKFLVRVVALFKNFPTLVTATFVIYSEIKQNGSSRLNPLEAVLLFLAVVALVVALYFSVSPLC